MRVGHRRAWCAKRLIAAFLTGTVILLFLGSWRSTLIVCISIPLSILTSLCILSLLGQTVNVMTLGGLALAVGILVDDATVEIENTHRNLGMGKRLVRAVLDGASQIAVPTLVSTLSICIVFVPVLLLTGTARYLFTPLAMAVVFAMLASYLLSRTLVPTMVHHLLRIGSRDLSGWRPWRQRDSLERSSRRELPVRTRFAIATSGLLDCRCGIARRFLLAFLAISFGSFWLLAVGRARLLPGRGRRPVAPARAHRARARASSRPKCASPTWSRKFESALPAGEIDTIIDNIGIPNAWGSIAQGDVPNIAATDGEISDFA